MKKLFSIITVLSISAFIDGCAKQGGTINGVPALPPSNTADDSTQPPPNTNNPPSPVPPAKIDLDSFFATATGIWYGKNLSSYQQKGGHSTLVRDVKKVSNGYTFHVSGTCRYVPSANASEMQSDYTSEYNSEYLFADELTGEVVKVCGVKYDGTLEKEYRGTIKSDSLHVDITPCYKNVSWGYVDVSITNSKVQMYSKTKNYDNADIICSSEPSKK